MSLARPFRRLLIANRGEIAIRIALAARTAGLVPLGIASDADADALHVRAMDDVARIGPGEASRSYLDIAKVLEAARALHAEAIHPGYGFLSERAAFARACEEAGLVFVGPPASAIEAMGDKAEAKRRARASDVPVVAGYDGDDASPARLRSEAAAIGVPLLVKATAGGGGRGLRIVRELAEFDEALAGAKREALAAFGDDRVLLERYVERPRHVEIQILADTHGTVLAFGERECSIQRRHQKVIEEAPSPVLGPDVRERMIAAAIRVATSVGYVNAGTVEFLLEPSGRFAFLEMNARLQVEHPITELVHGVDLVRLQFDVASGRALDPGLTARGPRGAAIEARIVAEDAARDDLPATGTIARWSPHLADLPDDGERIVRLDSGVDADSEISIFYDSLLAKLIVWGPDRAAAVRTLRHALGGFDIEGLPTNLPLLRAIAGDAAFAAGDTTTAFLGERAAELAAPGPDASDDVFLLAAAALAAHPGSWRIGGTGVPVALATGSRSVRGRLLREDLGDGRERLALEGDLDAAFEVERLGTRLSIEREGSQPSRVAGDVVFDDDPAAASPSFLVRFRDTSVRVRVAPPPRRVAGLTNDRGAAGTVTSPMPGKIVRLAVAAGDEVTDRALLVVLEAMKMEHRIVAPASGRVTAVHVREGAIVPAGARLVEIARA